MSGRDPLPRIDATWEFVSAKVLNAGRDEGWVTDAVFLTPSGRRCLRFIAVIPILPLTGGFELIEVENQNAGGRNYLESGRFKIRVYELIDSLRCEFYADDVYEIFD